MSSDTPSRPKPAQRADYDLGETTIGFAAAVVLWPEDPQNWLTLIRLEVEGGRWTHALSACDLAERAVPTSVEVALRRPQVLLRSGRFEAARQALERVVHAWSHSALGPADLVDLLWQADPVACFEAGELAVQRGLRDRDETLLVAINAGGSIGEFSRTHALLSALADGEARERAKAKLRADEAVWSANEQAYRERFPAGCSLAQIARLLDTGESSLAQHITLRKLLAGVEAEEHDLLVDFAHRFGEAGGMVVQWGAYATQRHQGRTAVLMHYLLWLFLKSAFQDAAALLRVLPQDGGSPDLLRLKIFSCAVGAFSRAELRGALLYEGAGDQGTRALATSYLRNSEPAVLGDLFPRAAIERQTSGLAGAFAGVKRLYVSSPLQRPRIAVCVSGQLRSFRQTWPLTREAMAAWEPTVFVSTWADTGAGFGSHELAGRSLPAAVWARLAEPLRRRDVFERRLPRTAAAMARNSLVSQEELSDLYGTEFVKVHDEADFEARYRDQTGLLMKGNLNQAKMFYTLTDCVEMKSAYEAETRDVFDAVLRMRPDRALVSLGEADVRRVATERVVLSDYFMAGAIGDQGTLSPSEVSDRMGDIWPLMRDAGHSRFFPGSTGRFNEFLLAEYLMHQGVGIGAYHASYSFGLTPIEPDFLSLWPCVVEDLAAEPEPDPDRWSIFAAFLEEAATLYTRRPEPGLILPMPAIAFGPGQAGVSARAVSFLSLCPRR